ncbi:MAG TPA: ribosome assembly cofactor RimP [Luteibaculaceae bacterium]|nr:ribosome assembly cofactor RimP [Luteibaculaceae bacterium]
MISTERVKELIDERIAGTELFLVELRISAANHIAVEIDGMQGVSVQDCLSVSRQIEGNLDREIEDYSLEVSSPGLDKPLRMPKQYIKNLGRKVKVMALDGREVEGELVNADDLGFEVSTTEKKKVEGSNKKVLVTESHPFTYDQIKSTHIIISFK